MRHIVLLFACLIIVGCATATFKPWSNDDVYQGKGGSIQKVEGIDVWDYGEPDQPYRIIGIIQCDVPITGGHLVLASMLTMNSTVIDAAKQHGADGIVPLTNVQQYVGQTQYGRSMFSLQKVVVAIKYVPYKRMDSKTLETKSHNYVKKAYTGLAVATNNNKECEVVGVDEGSPAFRSDIRIGDIILSIDGEKITDRNQLFKIYNGKLPGETISGELRRHGTIIKKQLLLDAAYMPYDIYVLNQELVKDVPLRIAIIIDQIDIKTLNLDENNIIDAKRQIESLLYPDLENMYVRFCNAQNNCSVIDRHRIDVILQELRFQKSNLVSDDLRAKIGQLSGATHLVIVSLTVYAKQKNSFQYQVNKKLVEVKSGKILFSLVERDEVTN